MNPIIQPGHRLFVWLFLGTLISSGPSAAIDIPDVERHLVFRDSEGSVLAECIETLTADDEGGATTWKILTPEKHRAIWVSDYVADETLFSGKFMDLETGWTASLAIVSDTPSGHPNTPSVGTFLSDLKARDAMLTVSLETSDGFYAEHQASINASPDEDVDWQPAFGHKLAQSDIGLDLPASVSEEIRFIHKVGSNLTREGSLAFKLIELLYQELERARERDSLNDSDPYEASRWEVGVGTVEVGSEDEPRATHRELAERFKEASSDATQSSDEQSPEEQSPDG
ncbi:MAG: hypothetical protein SX243_09300 [Acidobacteriota bacterium]|nr:hypothetical protein [Acidobacteriota bacterium]